MKCVTFTYLGTTIFLLLLYYIYYINYYNNLFFNIYVFIYLVNGLIKLFFGVCRITRVNFLHLLQKMQKKIFENVYGFRTT